MTIQAAASEKAYAGDGVSTVFAIPFPFDTAADLKLTSTDSASVISTLSTGFTISGGGGSTGNATFAVAPVTGVTITIYDTPAQTQPTNYVSLDAFPAASHEKALDRVTRIAKRLAQQVGRAIRAPDGEKNAPVMLLPAAASRANLMLTFDNIGNVLLAPQPIAGSVTQSIIGLLLYPRTAAEIGAGVTPANYAYVPGDPRRYGSNVGTGGDDTSAINQCLLSNKLTLFRGALTYNISAAITPQNGATIDFLEATLNLNDPSGLLSHVTIGNGTTQYNNVTIRNGIFTRTQVATGGYVIDMSYVGGVTVQNALIYGNSFIYGGIRVLRGINTNVFDSVIQNCTAYGINTFGTGIGANESNGLRVDRCLIQYCPTGLNCGDYVEGLYVRNNVFYSCTTAGFSYGATNGRISLKIQQNDFDTCGLGVYVQNLTNITINENWFSNNTGTSLVLKNTTGSVTVNGNQFYSSASQKGMEIGGSNTVASANIISGGSAGVYVKSTATGISITANRISSCTYAVDLSENPVNVSVVGNNLLGNVTGTVADAVTPNARYVADNMGYNPLGAVGVGMTASPMTYTAGSSSETLNVWGGTGISVTIGGVTYISGATQATFKLGPQKAAVITYTGSPFMTKYIE